MNRWFRMYDELLDNPKVQRLSGDEFKAWVNILCLASRNDGVVPSVPDIAFALRLDEKKTAKIVASLVEAGLLKGGDGGGFEPNKWNERQYKSDVSTDRVKRFRKRCKEQDAIAAETPPDTEADTEKSSVTNVTASEPLSDDPDKAFWATAKSYLKPFVKGDPGQLVGKWCRDFGKTIAASAITAAQVERAVDPVSYVEATLRKPALKVVGGGEWVSPC